MYLSIVLIIIKLPLLHTIHLIHVTVFQCIKEKYFKTRFPKDSIGCAFNSLHKYPTLGCNEFLRPYFLINIKSNRKRL